MNSKVIPDYFQNRREEILRSLFEIVELESPSKDAAGIDSVADWLQARTKKISPDFTVERIAAFDFGEHFITRCFQSDEKPILLLGHFDTVHPRGTKRQNPTRLADGKFYGCGSFDMKANIVLILEVLRAFKDLNLTPRRPVNILLSCDEEIGSPTGREIVEREARRAECCFVLEPSANGSVKTGRKGTGLYRLKARGIPAHAGLEPEKGASAILELARQIEQLHELNDLKKGTTVNVCTVEGGTVSNVIPEHASCEIDARFTSLAEAERIEAAIKKLRPFDGRVKLELTGAINRPPLERTEAVVKLYEKARRIAAEFDYELSEKQVGGASDGNFVGALGVPVLDGLGISGDGAHTLEEFIYVDDFAPRAALLAAMILEI